MTVQKPIIFLFPFPFTRALKKYSIACFSTINNKKIANLAKKLGLETRII